jgi:hypothetical protein
MRYAMIFAMVGLAACKGGDTDNTDTDMGCTDSAGCDSGDSDTPVTFDPGSDITLDWDAVDTNGAVTVSLQNAEGATGFFLGMAETASGDNGWYGEDCADQGDCHHITGSLPISADLAYVETIGEVVPGSTTLFDGGTDGGGDAFTADHADRLTYLFQIEGGEYDLDCYVWGDDPTYYAAEGCTEL